MTLSRQRNLPCLQHMTIVHIVEMLDAEKYKEALDTKLVIIHCWFMLLGMDFSIPKIDAITQ